MTCFWRGVLTALNKRIFVYKINNPKPREFISVLKLNAIKTKDVLWNGNSLTEKELNENLQGIKELNINEINRGYDCSTCDPYLLLICQLFKVHINHDFNGARIEYRYNSPDESIQTIHFKSDSGHFWAKK